MPEPPEQPRSPQDYYVNLHLGQRRLHTSKNMNVHDFIDLQMVNPIS